MSAEVVKSKDTKPEVVPQGLTIKSIRLVHTAPFNGTESDCIRMGPGQCTRVMAIRIDADNQPVAIGPNQRADGFLLEFVRHDRVTNKSTTESVVVLNSGIRAIVY